MNEKQEPRECKHYIGVAACEFGDEGTLEATSACRLFHGYHCPDFEPKTNENG